MALRNHSRFWRKCRIAFRRFRISAWLLILVLLGALLYLNQVGLPGFVKTPLLQKLHARGLDLQFTRLRWRPDRGIIAENVRFWRVDEPTNPRLTLKEVDVQLDYRALLRCQFQVDSLILRQGSLAWSLGGTGANTPLRELRVEKIQTELRLLPGDLWQIDHFQAEFAGGNFQLTGTITNASALREWKWFHLPPEHAPAHPGSWADTLDQIHLAARSQLNVDVHGDARDLRSFAVQANLNAPGIDTPWGSLEAALASVQLFPAAARELPRAEVRLQAANVQTPRAAATNLTVTLSLVSLAPDTNAILAGLDLTVADVATKWGGAGNAHFSAQSVHTFTNALPLSGTAKLELDRLTTRWGSATNAQFTASLLPTAGAASQGNAAWTWCTNLASFALAWESRLTGLQSPGFEAEDFSCAGQWLAPELRATRISARLDDSNLDAEALLNVSTRELSFKGSSDFDVQRISALLTEKSRLWLSQFSWTRPPQLQAEGTLLLPAWTNDYPDGYLEMKPTVRLQGHFHVDNCGFRGVLADAMDSHFSCSNEVWTLPDLAVTRPEGRLDLVHQSNERTRDYYFHVRSTIDLRALRPLLEPDQQRAFDLVGFSRPPAIEGEVRGRWFEPDRIGLKARLVLTNFTLRGESADTFQTALEYTNGILTLIQPRLARSQGTEQLTATGVSVDCLAGKAYVTNGFSTADPLPVTRAIGPRVSLAVEPYRFLRPPTVHVEGIIPLRDVDDADLHFDVEGGPFEWWNFKVPHISGKMDWVKEQLVLRDVRSDFYSGVAAGGAAFDFSPEIGTDFTVHATAIGAELHSLMADLSSKTNQLEGFMTAQLAITHANSKDWLSAQGRGSVQLRDGLIWEIPVFGILSPMLDAVMPGLGNSRASEGSATFSITNGVISSDDLQIKSAVMRLRYWGRVDLAGRVDAHAEAELLRDAWMVGRVLSLALWPVSKLFEYQITGTLSEPRSEPVFLIPKLMLLPFHPIRTLKTLEPEPPAPMQTNAPPAQF